MEGVMEKFEGKGVGGGSGVRGVGGRGSRWRE